MYFFQVQNILKYLFPVPKEDGKRVITFANQEDYISFRWEQAILTNVLLHVHKTKITRERLRAFLIIFQVYFLSSSTTCIWVPFVLEVTQISPLAKTVLQNSLIARPPTPLKL